MDAYEKMLANAVKSLDRLNDAQGYVTTAQVNTNAVYHKANPELLTALINHRITIMETK